MIWIVVHYHLLNHTVVANIFFDSVLLPLPLEGAKGKGD